MVAPQVYRVKIKEKERVRVLSYIFSCIKAQMTKTETIDYLANAYKIQADKTALVWEKMEEENEEFMEIHYMMISVNEEIRTFHMLTGMQKMLRKQIHEAKAVVLRYIERCIQRVMTKDQTIKFLAFHCNIDAALTRAGWKKIKGENKQMFDDYYGVLEFKNRTTCKVAERLHACGLLDSAESTNL